MTVHVGFYNGYKNDISELFQPRLLKRAVLQLILHPSYDPTNPNTVANNLGLVKVLTPVKYSKTIFPVQLPSPGDKCNKCNRDVVLMLTLLLFQLKITETKQLNMLDGLSCLTTGILLIES